LRRSIDMGERTQTPSTDVPPDAPVVRTKPNRLTLPRWSAWGLAGTWGAYWLALAAYEVVPAAWQVLVAEIQHRHTTVSLNYTGSLLLLGAVIAGPPLLLSAAWLATRPPREG
jgi:hypothetical protein